MADTCMIYARNSLLLIGLYLAYIKLHLINMDEKTTLKNVGKTTVTGSIIARFTVVSSCHSIL